MIRENDNFNFRVQFWALSSECDHGHLVCNMQQSRTLDGNVKYVHVCKVISSEVATRFSIFSKGD